MPRYLNEYQTGKTILDLAKEANFSPHLFARQVVEYVATGLPKKMLGDAIRDPLGVLGPSTIAEEYQAAELVREDERRQHPSVTRLALEVKEAQDSDPLHGPERDKKSHLVGVEFEVVLEHYLREMGEALGN